VSLAEARVKEAHKLGLVEAVTAASAELRSPKGFNIRPMEAVADLVAWTASQQRNLARIA
jgi:hypothetical protein